MKFLIVALFFTYIMIYLDITFDTENFIIGIILIVLGILGMFKNSGFGVWIPPIQTFLFKKYENKSGLEISKIVWNIIFILVGLILIGKSFR